ncbi:MAG: hypothetical protein ACTSYB_14030 [Candidatus Helarchaeota archaeon]
MTDLEIFNGVMAIHAFIDEKTRLKRKLRKFICPSALDELKKSLKFKMGADIETIFLLKEDIYVELGSPRYESVAFIVLTQDPEEVQNGVITLIGPDIHESKGKELNFGQVILIGGTEIEDIKYREMERALFHLKNLEGFMIRAVPNKLWCRVSKQVGFRGFSFEDLGKALMIMYKEQFPDIETIEILFITTESPQDFLELKVIGTEIRKKYIQQYSEHLKSKLVQITEKQRDDCEFPWTCDECDYNEVCDEIRDIVEKMKAYREKMKKN